jgi:putative toxin-antitoxin system antitoxin component (TIGR02293 family)
MTVAEIAELSEARRIARFLGLPNWRRIDDIGLVDSVRKGFPAGTARTVAERIDPEGQFVKATDIIPKSTLSRRKDKPLTRDESERVLALSRVFAETLRIYGGDARLVAMFLRRAHPMLAGRSPIELAKESIAGADLVLKLLAKADAGVAA